MRARRKEGKQQRSKYAAKKERRDDATRQKRIDKRGARTWKKDLRLSVVDRPTESHAMGASRLKFAK